MRVLVLILISGVALAEININGNNLQFVLKYSIKAGGRTGQICKSDFSCTSLCCRHGVCRSHNPSMRAFCAKSPGQSCVSRSYCRKQIVQSCYIVKTGKDTCALRCYKKNTFMKCRNGRCTSLKPPPVPAFNPANPDCTDAIDPPLH